MSFHSFGNPRTAAEDSGRPPRGRRRHPQSSVTSLPLGHSEISGKLLSNGIWLIPTSELFTFFVLILPGRKLGFERLQVFHGETQWATTFGFVANLIYKLSVCRRSRHVSGTVHRQPETLGVVELEIIFFSKGKYWVPLNVKKGR